MIKYTISVVIAVKNESLHLKQALESVLNQRDVSHEVILVDDNSTDDSLEIAKSLVRNHPNLTILRNIGNGKCRAFNLGVSKSSGSFICLFAGDDIMPEGSLVARLNSIQNISDVQNAISLSKILSFSTDKRFDGVLAPRKKGLASLSGVSPLMSRNVAEKIFPVPETLPNEDTWMELAILYLPGFQVIHTDIVCCQWRVHSGNSINMQSDFNSYNIKITERMKALELFHKKYHLILKKESLRELEGRIDCEEARKHGSLFGIMFSKVSFSNKLRSISILNSFFYNIRKVAFKLLSGWSY